MAKKPSICTIERFMNVDYIIIGAGVIGSSTAYHLKKALPVSKILLI